jgi:hypothetical protein
VDVVDSEFSVLITEIKNTNDLQAIMRAHRSFVSNILRLAMVDNSAVQECIDRILSICLRFVSLCWYLEQQTTNKNNDNNKLKRNNNNDNEEKDLLKEELDLIYKDFISNTSYLFQIMRKVENRGFMFRLDFNSYLSTLFFNNDQQITTISK